MPISAVYILDLKGKPLISRNFRGDIPPNTVERFAALLNDDELDLPPVYHDDGLTFCSVKYHNVYLLAVTKANSNATMIVMFLYRMVDVFRDYFNEVEEESVRDNFVVIYELMDELMDFGYPQCTDAKILQEFIHTESNKMELAPTLPSNITGAVNWRPDGLKYKKNEVFLDVIESVNLLVAANGNPIRSDIRGNVRMRVQLSGMPELKLGLNDKILFLNQGRATKNRTVELEDVKFHQCVRLPRFETDRTISFIPPDGEFELMSYRLNTQVKPLFVITATVESRGQSVIEYTVRAKSQFKERSTANNVDIEVPVSPNVSAPIMRASMGTTKYVPEHDALVWSFRQFPGNHEYLLRARFSLPSITNDDGIVKAPIRVKFEIPYFTISGIQVRYLKIIEKSGYQALPWVRYITQNGDYQVRMA